MSDNLKFWESVEKTNPANTKGAKIGQLSITAINATSQAKAATDKWGMYGNTWGLKDITYAYMDIEETKLALVGAVFYYPDGEFELHSSIKVCYKTNGANGYLKIDDGFMKKIETDLTTKGLSKLGFNTDVFMGLYDDNRYVQEMKEEFKPVKAYKTPSKQTPQDKKEYWIEFSGICKSLDVVPLEFISEWMGLDMEDKPAVQGAVAKYLKDKDMFAEQLQNYKDNKNNS